MIKYNENDIEVAVSTQNLKSYDDLIKKMKITSDCLIINQYDGTAPLNNKKVINKNEKGLSKSRNEAIKNAKNDIILIADDDVSYNTNYKEIIVDAYNEYKNADIICFYVKSKNNKRKTKKMFTGKVGYLRAMKIISCEISFKRTSIINNNLKFDENYGSGTKFNRGEEQIFLYEALKKGLKVLFINKQIGEVSQNDSIWFSKYDENFFYIQGQVFKRLSPKFYKLLIFQYAIRKYFLYHHSLSFKATISCMLKS